MIRILFSISLPIKKFFRTITDAVKLPRKWTVWRIWLRNLVTFWKSLSNSHVGDFWTKKDQLCLAWSLNLSRSEAQELKSGWLTCVEQQQKKSSYDSENVKISGLPFHGRISCINDVSNQYPPTQPCPPVRFPCLIPEHTKRSDVF